MPTLSPATSQGYFFLNPWVLDRSLKLANGNTVIAHNQHGVVVCEDSHSPLYRATFYSQGTTVKNSAGVPIVYVELIELIGPEGDAAWACGLNTTPYGPCTFDFVSGLGQWQGISGALTTTDQLAKRADGRIMLNWQATWQVDPHATRGHVPAVNVDAYSDYDTGYSFHGPHVETGRTVLADGPLLVYSTQAGVLLSQNENSPRHNATCRDRGTTIQTAEGQAQGDVMLLEDTDAHGDMTWLYHEWWYGAGPGTYRFLGGTGQWANIVGQGHTLGMLAKRADDHYMPTWELRWRLEH